MDDLIDYMMQSIKAFLGMLQETENYLGGLEPRGTDRNRLAARQRVNSGNIRWAPGTFHIEFKCHVANPLFDILSRGRRSPLEDSLKAFLRNSIRGNLCGMSSGD